MEFLWPGFLFLLVINSLCWSGCISDVAARRFAVRYSSLELVRAALPNKSTGAAIFRCPVPSWSH